jgi:ATP-dependent exoDNAse (exonuclease V) beta subunit
LLNIYDTRLNQIYLPLAEEAYKFLDKKMSDSGFLDYESLLVRARNLLKNNPDLLNYYRKKIKFIMVDEFQDTDSLQYELINLIAKNRGANTFIVGDPTQSIFRFRGGDPTVFKAVKDSEREPKRFSYNYRSEKPLIEFYNNFFRFLLSESYQEMQARKDLQTQGSNMEFIFTLQSSASEWRNGEAQNIARRILQLREHGCAYKDIALIFRSKKYIYLYENALRESGIPFSSASGSGFFGRSEIRDVVVFLKYLLNPKDKIVEACVLRSPFCGASDNELLSYYYHRDEAVKISQCLGLVKKIRNDFPSLTPLRLIERLFEETSYDASVLALPEGRAKHANLTKLINIFGRLESLGYGVEEILDYLDSSSGEDTEPLAQSELEEEDSVKVLTVHKAKGLEFPVVFLADLNHGSGGGRENMLARREGGFLIRHEGVRSGLWEKISELERVDNMEEEKRSLYVAKTRAKELLIIAVGGKKDSRGKLSITKSSFADILNSVFDFPSGIETKEHVEFAAMRIPVWTLSGVEALKRSEEKDYMQPAGIDVDEVRKSFAPILVPEEDEDEEEDRIQKLGELNTGTLMHRFLEIWDFDEGSIDSHVSFVLSEGYVPGDQFDWLKSELRKMALKFLKSKLMVRMKNAKRVYREVPFYFLMDKKPKRGRIDLVLEEDAGPALFDYKHVNREEELLEYKDQIERYARIVERRFGIAPTEKFFVLLPEVKLVSG